MATHSPAAGIRSILVALDNSPASVASLELAAWLAAHHRAELCGLFVEDENLLRLEGLPIARHVSLAGAGGLSAPDLGLALRAQSSRVRAAVRRVAEAANLKWSFRAVRGEVKREVLAAADAADFVALGRLGWRLGGGRRIGSTGRELLAKSGGALLMLARPEDLTLPLAVVWESSAQGLEALRLGAALSNRRGQRLLVLVPYLPGETETDLREQAAAAVATEGIEAEVELVALESAPERLLEHLLSPRRLLVLPVGGPRLPAADLCLYLESHDLTVLCVRPQRPDPPVCSDGGAPS